ncbi:hypothetical protein ACSFA8_26785 [Variovorax sp. RT4R15]|uniref:hypothetical protein n=1 Tax=Variovorax sp. RT4R15 TaxID=3443737 RepID=UPI003F47633E
MDTQNLILAALFLVSLLAGVGYVTLGLRASDYLKDPTSGHGVGWLFWWSFATDQYNDEGKKLCRGAQGLALFIIGLTVGWNWLLLRGQ